MDTQNFTHDPMAGRYTHRTARHIFVELVAGKWEVWNGLTCWSAHHDLGNALLDAEQMA